MVESEEFEEMHNFLRERFERVKGDFQGVFYILTCDEVIVIRSAESFEIEFVNSDGTTDGFSTEEIERAKCAIRNRA